MRPPKIRRLPFLITGLFVCAVFAQTSGAATVQGFEPGDPAIVTKSGDAGVKTGAYETQAPPQGSNQYLITTIRAADNEDGITNQNGADAQTFVNYNSAIFFGNAPSGGDGSGVLIPFTIGPDGALELTLQYDFLSNEPGQTIMRNDFAVAGIFNSLNVLQGTVTKFVTVTTAGGASMPLFGDQSIFVFHSGITTLHLSVAGFAPGNYNLALGVEDATPGADHASGLLIDNVQVVPEPSTVALGLAGAVLLVALRKGFKRA